MMAAGREKRMEVQGQFDPRRFYETIAGILSRKYGAKITVEEVRQKDEQKPEEKIA